LEPQKAQKPQKALRAAKPQSAFPDDSMNEAGKALTRLGFL
jgi:hypothetical protein